MSGPARPSQLHFGDAGKPTRAGVIAKLWYRRAQLRRLVDTATPKDFEAVKKGLSDMLDLLDEAQEARDMERRRGRR